MIIKSPGALEFISTHPKAIEAYFWYGFDYDNWQEPLTEEQMDTIDPTVIDDILMEYGLKLLYENQI